MPAVLRLGLLAALACLCLSSCGESDGKAAAGATTAGCSKGAARGPLSELRFRVESSPGAPGSFAETLAALCRRLSPLRSTTFSVRRRRHELVVRVPRRLEADLLPLLRPGRIAFFDWDANVLGPNGPDAPFDRLFDAVQVASASAARAEATDPVSAAAPAPEEADRRNDAFGELHYLFGPEGRLLAGPAAAPGSLATVQAPAGARILKVPQGITVVAGRGRDGGWFVIEDDAEFGIADISGPRATPDPQTRAPAVTFGLTDSGRTAFSALTRRVAQRGAAGRIAIVLDRRVVSFVSIDPAANPDGLDGSAGGQISEVGSRARARGLALLLRSGVLPANLVPLFDDG